MSGRVDLKVVMLGNTACGKTSLVERYIYKRFNTNYQATIGAAFGARKVSLEGRQLCLGVWDTAGSERYQAMSRIYYRDAKAAIICYDITDAECMARAKFWVKEVKENEESCSIYLCGTKLDLVKTEPQLRQVDRHDAIEYTEGIGGKHFETSSKTGENVDELFNSILMDFAAHNVDIVTGLDKTIKLTADGSVRSTSCCASSKAL